jgi:membrane-associated protease RseP (regulator of RpoE activity)
MVMHRIALVVGLLLVGGATLAASENKSDSKKHEKGFVLHLGGSRLGVQVLEISKEVREMLGAPADAGVLVNKVESDSAALEAGVKAGDVIVEIEGQKVADSRDIRESLADKDTGEKANLVVIREKSRKALTATVKKQSGLMGMHFPDDRFWTDEFGPGMRKQLESLQQRVAELEKKLQNLSPRQ